MADRLHSRTVRRSWWYGDPAVVVAALVDQAAPAPVVVELGPVPAVVVKDRFYTMARRLHIRTLMLTRGKL